MAKTSACNLQDTKKRERLYHVTVAKRMLKKKMGIVPIFFRKYLLNPLEFSELNEI